MLIPKRRPSTSKTWLQGRREDAQPWPRLGCRHGEIFALCRRLMTHRNRPGSWLRARVSVPERSLSARRHGQAGTYPAADRARSRRGPEPYRAGMSAGALLPRFVEGTQVRRRLVLLGRHEETVSAQELDFITD